MKGPLWIQNIQSMSTEVIRTPAHTYDTVHVGYTNCDIKHATHTFTNTATLENSHHPYVKLEDPHNSVLEMGINPQRNALHVAENSEPNLYDKLAPKDDTSIAEETAQGDIRGAQLSDGLHMYVAENLESNLYDKLATKDNTSIAEETAQGDIRGAQLSDGLHMYVAENLESNLYDKLAPKDDTSIAKETAQGDIRGAQLSDGLHMHVPENSEPNLYDKLAPKDDTSIAAQGDIRGTQLSDGLHMHVAENSEPNLYDKLAPKDDTSIAKETAQGDIRGTQLSDGYVRLSPKREPGNNPEMGHTYINLQNGKMSAMSPKHSHVHVYDKIDGHRGEDQVSDTSATTPCTCISETCSKSSSHGKVISERGKAHSFSSTLTSDVTQEHKKSLTTCMSLPNSNGISPDADAHVYDTIDDPKILLFKSKQTTDNPEDQTNIAPNTGKGTYDMINATHVNGNSCDTIKHACAGVHFFYRHTLECDDTGLEHTIDGHNITLRIPKGAIATGEKLHINIGVTMFGPFTFPENFSPISPILQFCTSEINYRFRKPITVILPHFISKETIEKLNPGEVRFAKAKHCNTGPERRQSYQFEHVDTRPTFASSGFRNFGVLQIQHCCYLCLMKQKNVGGAEYCLVQIKRPLQQRSEVHFLVSYFLDTCLRAIEEQYPPEDGNNNTLYTTFEFKFEFLEMNISTDYSNYAIAVNPNPAEVCGYRHVAYTPYVYFM